tara:strand:+ start:541 stop:720 length:180 start_codon:yes stop_codon:yes gene_type:complete
MSPEEFMMWIQASMDEGLLDPYDLAGLVAGALEPEQLNHVAEVLEDAIYQQFMEEKTVH